MSVIAFSNHWFQFCLNSSGLVQLGCGMSAAFGPTTREITSPKSAIEVEVSSVKLFWTPVSTV